MLRNSNYPLLRAGQCAFMASFVAVLVAPANGSAQFVNQEIFLDWNQIGELIEPEVTKFLDQEDRLSWGHVTGNRVDVTYDSLLMGINVDLDLKTTVDILPDPAVDVDIHIALRCENGRVGAVADRVEFDIDYPGALDIFAEIAEAIVGDQSAAKAAIRASVDMLSGVTNNLACSEVAALRDGIHIWPTDTQVGEWAPIGEVATCYDSRHRGLGTVEVRDGMIVTRAEPSSTTHDDYWLIVQSWTSVDGTDAGSSRASRVKESVRGGGSTASIPLPSGVTHVACDVEYDSVP